MAIGHQERLRRLIEAGIALGSELSLDDVLLRLVETAAVITGARYAALGVIDERGTGLERLVTVGIDAKTQAEIGELPVGRGILGVVIGEAKPLRLHDLTHDPRSVGFPPGHPVMRTFLGVPILLRGVAYGNLYLAEKEGGEDFSGEDEDLLTLLASQAAVAIENARLYEASRRWIRQLESLADVGNALASEIDPGRVLSLISGHLRELVDARLAVIALLHNGMLRIEAVDGEGAEELLGVELPLEGSKGGSVLARRRSERIDSIVDDPEFDHTLSRRVGARTALIAPLLVQDRRLGVIAVCDRLGRNARFSDVDLRVVETFAGRAAVAVDLSQRVARESMQAMLQAQEAERKRLARELHDETGQALTAILLGLRSVRDAGDRQSTEQALDHVQELAVSALEEVRQLSFELRPKALDDFGLAAALDRLVERVEAQSGLQVELEITLAGRLHEDVETAAYRTVQEALTNCVRHAGARRISIVVTQRDQTLTVLVEDDGRGFDPAETKGRRFGLVAMRERLGLLSGRLDVESTTGCGATLRATIPIDRELAQSTSS